MSDPFGFDRDQEIAEGTRLKEEGIESASEARKELLSRVKREAVVLAQTRGEISADDVAIHCKHTLGIDLSERIGNAAGSIFRGGDWEWTGKVRLSVRASRRRNMVRVWRLAK